MEAKFTKKDFVSCLITGLTAGFLGWWIISFSDLPRFNNISYGILVVLIPIVWLAGVKLGYILGGWFSFLSQFGKFTAVGFTNFAVDSGILDYMIFLTDANRGLPYTLFKAISFLFGVSHSYFWNRYWVFESKSQNQGAEFSRFIMVAVASAVVNVIAASLVVNFISPQLGLTTNAWANVGAVAGSASALIFSFIGFKVGVFKK